MSYQNINIKAFNLSPFFWWKTIENSISLTTAFGEEISPDFNFTKWLNIENIEHNSIEIHTAVGYENNIEYTNALKNDYFFKISGISIQGHKVYAKTIEERKY